MSVEIYGPLDLKAPFQNTLKIFPYIFALVAFRLIVDPPSSVDVVPQHVGS
jgi:hypothetical protein